MFAYWFLAVISTLAAASGHPTSVPPLHALGATAINVVAWGTLALTIFYQLKRDCFREPETTPQMTYRLDMLLQRLLWCWLPINALCILQFGWGGLTETLPGLQQSLFLKAWWLAIPTLCVVSTVWTLQHYWDRGILMRCGLESSVPSLSSFLWNTWRIQAGWLLAPLACFIILVDVIQMVMGEANPAALGCCIILATPCLLPLIMRLVWPTTQLNVPWINGLLRGAGAGDCSVRCWDTSGRIATAAVVGMLPHLRLLVISDGLFERLPRSQVAMVILHELSHLRRKHLWLRFMALIPIGGAALFAQTCLIDDSWLSGLVLASGGIASLVTLRLIAHWTEYDADHQACLLAARLADQPIEDVPKQFADAARDLASAINTLTASDPAARKATWLHPSVEMRIFRLNCRSLPIDTNHFPVPTL